MLDQSDGDERSFRSRIAHAQLRQLYDLWLECSQDGEVMPRSALDPVAIPGLLKNLILSDVGEGGREISYRLVGTDIVEAHGFDYTGWTVQRLTSGPTLAFTQRLYGMVVSRGVPVYSEGQFRWLDKEFHWTKRLHLPLSRDGDGQANMVLVGQFFEAEHGQEEMLLPARPDELLSDRATFRK